MEQSTESNRPKVWLLEDSPTEAAMTRRVLGASFDVEVFEEGSNLLERLAMKGPPSLLILDWQLPGVPGIDVCRAARALYDETILPILMLTVYGHKSDLVDGFATGANDYVTKPYDSHELLARATTLVRVRTLVDDARRANEQRSESLSREQAARAAAEAANAAKDEFLALLSHELRTPLSAILGWTAMARSGKLPQSEWPRVFETVERNARVQAQLIEDLLDMSRILSGKLAITLDATDIASVANAAIDALRPAAETKGVELTVSLPKERTRVRGDAGRLQQVIWNLLTNSIKFTPKGGKVSLDVTVDGRELFITVTDTGRGMAPELMAQAFEKFRQHEDASNRINGGLGLGLAIVKYIVERHLGTVSAHSDGVGKGSSFVVRLPRGGESSPNVVAVSPRATPNQQLTGLRLVLVEDHPDTVEMMRIALKSTGADVVAGTSAAEGVALVQSYKPHVIISDIGLAGENGYAMLRRIRERSGDGARIPAIALTAFATVQDRELALEAGYDAHIAKPVDMGALVALIARLAHAD